MSLSVSRDGTCSIMRISNLGGKIPSGYSRKYGYSMMTIETPSLKTFLEKLRFCIHLYDENNSMNTGNLFANTGLVMVTLATTQVEAINVLTEFGGWEVVSSEDMAKFDHEVLVFLQPTGKFIDRFNDFAKKFDIKALPRAEGKKCLEKLA